jgi:hypothetical protein
MKEPVEEVRKQFHEIRNLLGHLQLKVRDLEEQITEDRAALGQKLEQLESRVMSNSFTLEEHRKMMEARKKERPPNSSG